MANLRSRLCHISRCLVQSAISLEKAAEALDPDQLTEETEKNDTDSNGSGKMTNGFILSEIGGKIRDISGHVRLAALKIKNASEALDPDQLTQESEKNDDGKRGQDQLYDGDFEIYHTARLTSADLAGRSAEDQRQITQAEWGLMSDGAKQCFTGQALEEELNPAKKGRLDD